MRKAVPQHIIDYLMAGDPVIRWQTMKDLLDEDYNDIHAQRVKIEIEGWGKNILDLQSDNGLWNESLMIDQWQSTLWVLIALKRFGVYPLEQFRLPCQLLIDTQQHFTGGIKYEGTEKVHTCLSGLTLGVVSYFRYLEGNTDAIFDFLIEKQSSNGSWYCEHHTRVEESIFATTLAVLEGLREYQKAYPAYATRIQDMQREAHKFLFSYDLFKIGKNSSFYYPRFMDFSFPYLQYDLLTVMDYFREIGMKYNPEMKDGLDKIQTRTKEGLWYLDASPPLKSFDVEDQPSSGKFIIPFERVSMQSRFNTLRALRVLHHWKRE